MKKVSILLMGALFVIGFACEDSTLEESVEASPQLIEIQADDGNGSGNPPPCAPSCQ